MSELPPVGTIIPEPVEIAMGEHMLTLTGAKCSVCGRPWQHVVKEPVEGTFALGWVTCERHPDARAVGTCGCGGDSFQCAIHRCHRRAVAHGEIRIEDDHVWIGLCKEHAEHRPTDAAISKHFSFIEEDVA